MLNSVVIQGRIGSDIELTKTGSGSVVTSIMVAVDRDFKDENGERETDWFPVVFWGKRAEFLQKYFTKGAQIIIHGRLQSRRWEDKNGQTRNSIEIVAEETYFAGNSNRKNDNRDGFENDEDELSGMFDS